MTILMEPILSAFIASFAGKAGEQIAQSLLEQDQEGGNTMSVDQAIDLGLVKNYGEIFPEISEYKDGLSSFAQDVVG